LSPYLDVLTEINKSKALVLPSTREGFGIVLVEAGAESNRQTMGVAGRNLVQQKFTWDRNNREVEQVYLAALGAGQ
jgi:glycosyltransferase involved in cell wall biosynthesis